MDASFFREWLGLISLVIALGGTFYAWLTSKSKINAEHLARVDDKLAGHGAEITKLRNDVDHLPAKEDVIEMKLALAKIEGTIGRMDESLNNTNRIVFRMDEWLMKEKNRE